MVPGAEDLKVVFVDRPVDPNTLSGHSLQQCEEVACQ